MKVVLKIASAVIVILILVSAAGGFYLTRGLDSGKKLIINDVNAYKLEDGTYYGKYNAGRWTNEVKVLVNDHKIIKINVIKDVTFSKEDVKKEILNRVIYDQSTKVDVITGSTVTSKAYLKAIENALNK